MARNQEKMSNASWDDESSSASSAPTSQATITGLVIDDEGVHEKDVLCGRDRHIHSHPGNRCFRHLINTFRERYQNAKHREAKTAMTSEIVDTVKKYGGRFLKQDPDGRWREVDQSYAHEKVSHALRSAKDPNRPKPKRTRTVAIKPPSEDEERYFQRLVIDQEQIYQRLLSERGDHSC